MDRPPRSNQAILCQHPTPKSKSSPDLPVELVERILSHVFLRPTPDTPSSDRYPLAGTTHVLLVSKAVHELALPFFLHSITITRPEDYLTFFDPDKGLFSGPESLKRWPLVWEISLVAFVRPPVRSSYEGEQSLLVPLSSPAGRRVASLCVLDAPREPWDEFPTFELPDDWAARVHAERLVQGRTSVASLRDHALARLHQDHEDNIPPSVPEYDFDDHLHDILPGVPYLPDGAGPDPALEQAAIDYQIALDTRDLVNEQQRAFVKLLIAATSPLATHDRYPSRLLRPSPEDALGPNIAGVEKLVVHAVRGGKEGAIPAYRVVADIDRLAGNMHCRHVRLVGYSAKAMKRHMAVLEMQDTPGSIPTKHVQRWIWEAKDGKTTREMDLTDPSAKVVPH